MITKIKGTTKKLQHVLNTLMDHPYATGFL